jgi:lysylphosphatidylglycerol synthase-like protein
VRLLDTVATMVRAVFALAGAHLGWLVLAIILHVCGQVSRGVAWRGVLAVSWPEVTRRRACSWYVCGAGLSGVLSPRGGDAVRVTLAKRELKGATWPALAGTLCAEASFETVSGLTMMLAAVALGVGSLHAPPVAVLAAAVLTAAAVALLAARSARVRRTVREVGRGAAVLRRPGHCARHVLPFQAGARVLRLGSATCFLLAFGLPVAPAIVVAAVLAQGSGAAVPLPGAGPAAIGAALLVALPFAAGHALDGGALASLAVVWPAAITVVGVAISLALLARLSGARTPRALVRAARSLRVHPAPAAPLA